MEKHDPATSVESAAKWFAVYTLARHEAKVTEQVIKWGFEPFFPKQRTLSKRKDRKKFIEVPIFPGYIFVKVTPKDFNKLLNLPGIVKILGEKGKPTSIPEQEIESVRILVNSEVTIEPHPYLREGDKVRIVTGPLKGVTGWLLRVEPRLSLLVVSISILNRSIAIELSDEVVEKY